ncbi:MAG TPA: exonuclease [Thermodesulfobacteriota bacterium]|nr:exonuclease [Thermodesulfobacteriota bacterium]
MGILSSAVSITRYKVEGKLKEPVLDTILNGLELNSVSEIDDDISERAVGWTSFESPFNPDFRGSSFDYGSYLSFSLRIDKKTIPPKVLKKYRDLESARRLAESGRTYLSKEEKQSIKENVTALFHRKLPATPHVYDVLWNLAGSRLLFFSNLKVANEELETLFFKSFRLTLIRLFPYTIADLTLDLSPDERDRLLNLTPTSFME